MAGRVESLAAGWGDARWTDLAKVTLCSVLFVLARTGAKTGFLDELPGHSGMFWIPVLFLSVAWVGRPGVASTTSFLGSVAWNLIRGGAMATMAPYALSGVLLDVIGQGSRLKRLPVALLAGVACSLVKCFFHHIPRAVIGLPGDAFVAKGMLPVIALHMVFGLIGGFGGWLLISRAATRATHS